jgi:hypothetical protein
MIVMGESHKNDAFGVLRAAVEPIAPSFFLHMSSLASIRGVAAPVHTSSRMTQ